MARIARVVLPDQPHHVTQRGNRRQRTFFNDDDYQERMRQLSEACRRHGTQVWAWCLRALINATAGVHDVMQISLGDGIARDLLKFPDMVPAFGFTVATGVGSPLRNINSQQVVDISLSRGFRGEKQRAVYGSYAIGAK